MKPAKKTILTAVKQRYGRVNVCSKAAASRFYAITVTGVHTFHSFLRYAKAYRHFLSNLIIQYFYAYVKVRPDISVK